ncbi:hypothetical protein J2129_000926 [Methanofollis sp. W23]|uniref:DUF2111 domain-containing protein n=1 Tax=Methanofollis sp. W23 TaxID=2817849 RepID=UPI001AE3032B|nr:DUF2111 domain-containing protein [Methanofollis sp. W23]MBP2145472.1 hypothetical protein [Methanofollis sp. W23]
MDQYIISASSTSDDFLPVVMALHRLLGGLPVTARSREAPGLRVENDAVVDDRYTGPVLEAAIKGNEHKKIVPGSGPYQGVPVVVTPLRDRAGTAIGAIGVVDITGVFDLATLMEHHTAILQQVCGKDPCPLPSESVAAKR